MLRQFCRNKTLRMQTITNQSISYSAPVANASLWRKFLHWCSAQENNRLLWLGIALAAHGCILTPITVMAVLLAGTNLVLFMLAIIAMGLTVVTNLAAMPTRLTIPIFFFSVLIDIAIVGVSLSYGLDMSRTYI